MFGDTFDCRPAPASQTSKHKSLQETHGRCLVTQGSEPRLTTYPDSTLRPPATGPAGYRAGLHAALVASLPRLSSLGPSLGDWAWISSQESEVPVPARSGNAGGWTGLLLANLSGPLPPRKSLVMRKARLAGSHSGCLLLFMWHLWLALITSRARLPTPRLVKRLK